MTSSLSLNEKARAALAAGCLRATAISGLRFCPVSQSVEDWEEDQEHGCHWCESDEPHQEVVVLERTDA